MRRDKFVSESGQGVSESGQGAGGSEAGSQDLGTGCRHRSYLTLSRRQSVGWGAGQPGASPGLRPPGAWDPGPQTTQALPAGQDGGPLPGEWPLLPGVRPPPPPELPQ